MGFCVVTGRLVEVGGAVVIEPSMGPGYLPMTEAGVRLRVGGISAATQLPEYAQLLGEVKAGAVHPIAYREWTPKAWQPVERSAEIADRAKSADDAESGPTPNIIGVGAGFSGRIPDYLTHRVVAVEFGHDVVEHIAEMPHERFELTLFIQRLEADDSDPDDVPGDPHSKTPT